MNMQTWKYEVLEADEQKVPGEEIGGFWIRGKEPCNFIIFHYALKIIKWSGEVPGKAVETQDDYVEFIPDGLFFQLYDNRRYLVRKCH